MKKAGIYTISSVKGGVGKTSTVLNLAAMFSLLNKRVLIIDMDFVAGDVAARLDLSYEKDLYHCYEDIRNHTFDKVEDYTYSYKERIDVLPAPKDPRYGSKIEPSFLPYLLSKVTLKYDAVLIDTNHLLSGINLLTFDYSDNIFYVINNDSMNLKGIRTMVAIFESMESDKLSIILNDSAKNQTGYYAITNITSIIKHEIDYRIPKSFYLKRYEKFIVDGKIPMLDLKVRRRNKKTVKVFKDLATSLLEVN